MKKPTVLLNVISLLVLFASGCSHPNPPPIASSPSSPTIASLATDALPAEDATPYPLPWTKAPVFQVATITPSPISTDKAIFISDISFVDPQQGWLIGALCSASDCSVTVRKTDDGGVTWLPIPPPRTGFTISDGPDASHNVHRLRFAGPQVGWAFDPGLFVTLDGGHSWQDASPDQPVVALVLSGESVWRVSGSCIDNSNCSFQIDAFNQGDKNWQRLASQPSILGPELQLVRSGLKDAWILSWGEQNITGNEPYRSSLLATHDGGWTWQVLASPCENAPVEDRLAAADSRHLWALCGGLPGAGQQMKYLVISTDGGKTWDQKVDLGGGGYVNDLATANKQDGFIGLGRGALLASTNGGLTWLPAMDISIANPPDASGWRIFFIDPDHGWASISNQVFRTTDGGAHWRKTVVQ
jgi:photosystem II stability/assembly factor-like uncharacterized protein